MHEAGTRTGQMVEGGSSGAMQRHRQEQYRCRAWIRVHAAYERWSLAHKQLDVSVVCCAVPNTAANVCSVEHTLFRHRLGETLQGIVLRFRRRLLAIQHFLQLGFFVSCHQRHQNLSCCASSCPAGWFDA